MFRSFLSPAAAERVQDSFRRLEVTVETVFWDVTWEAFVVDRPAASNVYGQDVWRSTGTGEGKLRDTGIIDPSSNEEVLMPEAPFRLQCRVDSNLSDRHTLVIEGRVFKVEAFKPRAGERQHANAYLREMFYKKVPVDGEVVSALNA
jgi:hypothetical protein